jgi:hypothetical protein
MNFYGIFGFFRRFLVAKHWVKARTYASREDCENALVSLKWLEEHGAFSGPKGITRLGVYGGLLRSLCLTRVKRYDSAMEELAPLQRFLQDGTSEESRYLRCYAARLIAYAVTQLSPQTLPTDVRILSSLDYASVDLTKVPSHVKKNFPLDEHPQWGKK